MKIFVDDIDNLCAQIFIIGYSEQGESIVIFVKDKFNGTIYYSIIIDCYTYKNLHKTKEILDNYNIKNIDLLCWTHPDSDHSKGLQDIINNYVSQNTIYLLPIGVNGTPYDICDYSTEDELVLKEINKSNTGKNYSFYTAAVNPQNTQGVNKIEFVDSKADLVMNIFALAPITPLINRRIASHPTQLTKNDLSIAIIIEFGNKRLLFSGDIENPTINLIADNELNNLFFLKTPHHTSSSADLLEEKIEKKNYCIPIICTTTYKKHHLPDKNLVNKYLPFCFTFHSTGTDPDVNKNHGIIEYTISPSDKNENTIRLYGHAYAIKK